MRSMERENFVQPTSAELFPGGMSVEGFLAEGQTLEQVIKRDKEALKILGYSVQEVADLLGPVCEKAALARSFEYIAQNEKKYNVKVSTYRGSQECPWKDKVDWHRSSGATDIYLTKVDSQEKTIRIAGLLRHLVESHKFFEGGAYRVSPEEIIEMFGIERIPGSIEEAKKLKI